MYGWLDSQYFNFSYSCVESVWNPWRHIDLASSRKQKRWHQQHKTSPSGPWSFEHHLNLIRNSFCVFCIDFAFLNAAVEKATPDRQKWRIYSCISSVGWFEVTKQNRYRDKWLTDETYFRAIKAQFPTLGDSLKRGMMNRAISVCGGPQLDDFSATNGSGMYRRKAYGVDPFGIRGELQKAHIVLLCYNSRKYSGTSQNWKEEYLGIIGRC
jgi:hypothetical protein